MTSNEVLQSPVHIGPRRSCHVNLFVSDVERSLAFYNKVCGLEIVLRQAAINAGFLSNGNTNHDIGMIGTTSEALVGEDGHQIWGAGGAEMPGLYHIGWEMEHEFDLVKANVRAKAAQFRINRTVRHLSTRSLYAFDADANVHEFYADVSRDWRTLYAEGKRVSGHWEPGEFLPQTEYLYQINPEIRRVESAVVHGVRFSHVALSVQNFERMRLFFQNIAGLLEVYSNEDVGVAAYGAPASPYPVTLILQRASPRNKANRGMRYFALEIDGTYSIGEASDRLAKAGYAPVRQVDNGHKSSVFVADPDGLLVELVRWNGNPINFQELEQRGELEYGI